MACSPPTHARLSSDGGVRALRASSSNSRFLCAECALRVRRARWQAKGIKTLRFRLNKRLHLAAGAYYTQLTAAVSSTRLAASPRFALSPSTISSSPGVCPRAGARPLHSGPPHTTQNISTRHGAPAAPRKAAGRREAGRARPVVRRARGLRRRRRLPPAARARPAAHGVRARAPPRRLPRQEGPGEKGARVHHEPGHHLKVHRPHLPPAQPARAVPPCREHVSRAR
jgi:hypothetical protein